MAKMYYEKDCELSYLNGKKIAIIGYGSQGPRPCPQPEGLRVRRVRRPPRGSKNRARRRRPAWRSRLSARPPSGGDIVMILINDEAQAEVYKNDIAPYLTEGKALAFAHGFNIRYQQIVPPRWRGRVYGGPQGPRPHRPLHLCRRQGACPAWLPWSRTPPATPIRSP